MEAMGKPSPNGKAVHRKRQPPSGATVSSEKMKGMLWRVDRLERQVKRLSELVREHAEDADRLVQIVAEDREVLRQELMARGSSQKPSDPGESSGLDSLKLLS